MKIVPDNPEQDNKTLSAEQRQVATSKLLSSIAPHPGHTVWEFDLVTGLLAPAKIEKITVEMVKPDPLPSPKPVRVIGTTGTHVHKKVVQRPYCLYCSALNKKNAIKKFVPMYAKLVAGGHIIREQSIEPQTDKF